MDKSSVGYEDILNCLTVGELQNELFELQAEISVLQEKINDLRNSKKTVFRVMKRKIQHDVIERGSTE